MNMLPYDCVRAFAALRSEGLSLPFLKENGELLSIALCGGMILAPKSLALYRELYNKIDKLCELYPPFFRFFLAIALDLEDHGMPGQKGDKLIDFVIKNDLYTYETSDTRRMEIINLLSRRGRTPNYETDTHERLLERVLGFMERPDRFVKFNRPLFYELTHIIFYITNFGMTKVSHSEKLFTSLSYIGMLAYLDNDYDLLSEVCLCYIFLGREAPLIWVDFCRVGLSKFTIEYQDDTGPHKASSSDDYHIYLVISWLMAVTDQPAFQETYENKTPIFTQSKKQKSTLSKIFQALHPIVLNDVEKHIQKPISISHVLSNTDALHLQTALSATPRSVLFFDKLTNGKVNYLAKI